MEQTLTRPLTRAQQARRQRVIDAAMALGLEGGYEAVQMRDVAARADVAMGTVYRYFTSKDHLLAAALVHWVEQLDARLAQVPAQGDTAAARVIDVLDRALRSMGRQPQLAGAVFVALASPDPAAIECQQQVSVLMEGIITRAIGEPHPPDLGDRARILGHVWYSARAVVRAVSSRSSWASGPVRSNGASGTTAFCGGLCNAAKCECIADLKRVSPPHRASLCCPSGSAQRSRTSRRRRGSRIVWMPESPVRLS
jgi:AcrR family transcriptional regulator